MVATLLAFALGCEPQAIDVSPLSGLGLSETPPELPMGDRRVRFEAPEFSPEEPLFVRLTAPQYRFAIADIFGPEITAPVRLEPDLQARLAAVGAAESALSPKGAEHYVNGAKVMALQMTEEAYRGTLFALRAGLSERRGVL